MNRSNHYYNYSYFSIKIFMRTITLIFPVYNDWESLRMLLRKIEKIVKKKECKFKVLIINDNSININKKKTQSK